MEFVKMLFNAKEWYFFLKRSSILVGIFLVFSILWLTFGSLIVAPFYGVTKSYSIEGFTVYQTNETSASFEGETTVRAIKLGMDDLLKDGLVTNFIGVRNLIDNNLNEQIGLIEIYRVAMNGLENNLGRNRGTGGANKYLVQSRSDIYADYSVPFFTSYTTKLQDASDDLENYLNNLSKDKDKPMESKSAVFIVNSDNLAEMLDKMKQQLQTNLAMKVKNFTDVDDKFYKIRGNLLAMELIFKGLDVDFKSKMIDKSSYNENFLPIMEDFKNASIQNHWIILESLGHLSKIEKDGNVISQKLSELIDKLKKG